MSASAARHRNRFVSLDSTVRARASKYHNAVPGKLRAARPPLGISTDDYGSRVAWLAATFQSIPTLT
jgi:hypothetical protein